MQKYLISYRSEEDGFVTYGYDCYEGDPVDWVADIQILNGTFVMLNAQPMTDEQFKKYDGMLKGM